MIDSLLVEWLRDSALPMYQLGEPGQRYIQFREGGRWEVAPTFRNSRTLISIEVDCLLPDFENLIRTWLDALNGLAEAAGTLVFAVRTCCEFAGSRFILAAMAFAPRPVPEAIPLDGAEVADLLIQVCSGLTGQDSEAVHPALRGALARELAYRAEIEAQRQEDAAAEARALELLEGYLSPEQREELHTNGTFHVRTRDGRLFRFSKGFGHNVHLIENGVRTIEYCIITVERVPLYDQMLAQKVLLEAQPDEFFRIANFRALKPPTAAAPCRAELTPP